MKLDGEKLLDFIIFNIAIILIFLVGFGVIK